MDLRLRGKTALVTGASSGIGEAIALALALEDVHVAICARTAVALEAAAARIQALARKPVVPLATDLATLQGCRTFVHEAFRALGAIDILVNNAGASKLAPFEELPDADFVDAIDGKFLGYVRCCREVIPHMRARGGGVIVNITGSTHHAVPLHTAGGACNAAIRTFSKTLALELAPHSIRVNTVAPGRILTERQQQMLQAEATASGSSVDELTARMAAAIPSRRFGRVEDIADTVAFLVSDRASYINGAAITVDGSKSPIV
jgi:3-oxoacyl-[acyl-carrier protein] reductase